MDKRTFLKTGALAGATLLGSQLFGSESLQHPLVKGVDVFTDESGKFALPKLPYNLDALEPHIDKQTVEIHHSKHHAGYVKGLNAAVDKIKELIAVKDFSLIKNYQKESAFHGAGHFLHTMYWNNMGVNKQTKSKDLENLINQTFGSYDIFKAYFLESTKAVEGSGWGILAYQVETGKLVILQTEIHQNLSQWISIPILVCDVWEHAYYLKYQNKRADYIESFFQIINWDVVSQRLDILKSGK